MGRIEDAATPDGRDLLRYMGTIRRTAMIARDRLGVDPDDVAQETCLRLLAVAAPGARASRYVARATYNTAAEMRRRIDSQRRLADARAADARPSHDPSPHVAIDVMDAVGGLPAAEALAVRAAYIDGLDLRDAAAALEVGKSTVHRRLAAAGRSLRASLAAYAPESA